MKTPHKIYLAAIAILILMVAILSVTMNKQYDSIRSLKEANGVLQNENTTYKKINGKLVSQNKAAELRSKEFKQALPELADALTKQMDIKLRNLRAGLVAEFRASGRGNSGITRIDTMYLHDTLRTAFDPFALTFDDGYLNFKSDVYNELDAPSEYTYSDTLTYAFSMKGKWYQRKQLFGSGMLSNPNAKVVNSQAVLVNEFKDKRFGIGPYIGAGVTNKLELRYSVGVSLHWSLIKF